jgi:hypothetical protein
MEDDSTTEGGPTGGGDQQPESLLPYDDWTEAALRQVLVRALQHAAAHGLPGNHHFYITFLTDYPGVSLPVRLKAQYPQEMTIVLQHQFWDLGVDETLEAMSVGLSFGGVPCTLRIPLAAITAFADPQVRYGLRFRVSPAEPQPEPAEEPAAEPAPAEDEAGTPDPVPQVVSLDAFRRRSPPKES